MDADADSHRQRGDPGRWNHRLPGSVSVWRAARLRSTFLEAEPISGYQERSGIARRPGVYLYSELRSTGLAHLYVGQSGSPDDGIYGRYCQENNLRTPRREDGSRWRGGTSPPAAPAVTNAAMDELQRCGVRVLRDRTAFSGLESRRSLPRSSLDLAAQFARLPLRPSPVAVSQLAQQDS